MLIYKYRPEEKDKAVAITAGGTWSGNTEDIKGLCHQVYVKSASAGTVFDVTITDGHDIDVRKITGNTNILNDLTPWVVSGIHTITISNATADEVFRVLLCFRTN